MVCRTDRKSCAAWKFALLLLGIGAIALITMLFAPPAKGEALQGNHAVCANLGAVAVDVVETKAAGIPWEQIEGFIKGKLAEARKNPESYVKTDADERYVLKMLKAAWDSKEPSYEAGAAVYRDCMAKRI